MRETAYSQKMVFFRGSVGPLTILVCAFLLPAIPAEGTAAGDSPLNLTECAPAGVDGVVRCGTCTVHEDRAAGAGRTIPLNIMVLSALGGGENVEPLFILAGGPGGAAT